jgi:hypothetical protein
MFFGSIDNAVELCWGAALSASNMSFGDFHPDELSPKEAKVYFVIARMAHRYAKAYDMPQEVLDAIIKQYDELFALVLQCDEDLKTAIVKHKHKFLGGYSDENVLKYLRLAGLAS